MKKRFSSWSAVSIFFVLFALCAVTASAQSFGWNDPQKITSVSVTAIAVDPVTEAVYGIDTGGNISTLVLSTEEIIGVPPSLVTPPPPATAFATNQHGVLYVISATAIGTYNSATFTLIDQPKLPQDVVGSYKDIAIGKGGKIYLLFEADQSKVQYLLTGEPPAITAGVAATIKPTTLNLDSKGNWVDAFVSPPEGYDAEDIVPESIKIVRIQGTGPNGPIDLATEIYKATGGPCRVEREKLHFKFVRYNKQDPASSQSLAGVLAPLLPPGPTKGTYGLTLTIEGELESGDIFSATTTITVMVPKARAAKKH